MRVYNTTDVNQLCVHLTHFTTVQCLSKYVFNKQVVCCRILLPFVCLHLKVQSVYLDAIEQAKDYVQTLRKVDASCARQRAVLFFCSFLLHAII